MCVNNLPKVAVELATCILLAQQRTYCATPHQHTTQTSV